MDELTPHELSIMEKMTPQHKALMLKLSPKERNSMAQNVNRENIELIQSWIGTDEEIERILFWDKGGKYDDPAWQNLKPVDEKSTSLYEKARSHYQQLRGAAVESQRRSDLTLYSQFNSGLLFTGLAGAVRCDKDGRVDEEGEYFKGIEWRCIGSVEDNINSITIYPCASGEFEVHFGNRIEDQAQGIWVHTADSHSLLQLAQLAGKSLSQSGYEVNVKDSAGKALSLDPKAIRQAVMGGGEKIGYGDELKLYASVQVKNINSAIEAADNFSQRFYERFGLETECYKIGKKYGNFFIMRDENFDRFLPLSPVKGKGLVLITATLACRRCRRELEEFRDLAKSYPHVTCVLVNLNSPQFKFYERVFGDMGGGDPDNFRKTAAGVTPFVIIYTPNENRILKFNEYYSTGKAENTPSIRKLASVFKKYFL
jgi:hypothetical protein